MGGLVPEFSILSYALGTVTHPVAALAIAASYASAVAAGYRLMRERKRRRAGWAAPAHNLFMALASAYTFAETCATINAGGSGPRLERSLCAYYLLRVCALADTLLVIARKRDRQLTLLHVGHRALAVFPGWSAAITLHPGTSVAVVCAASSLVDSLVYVYYGIASLGLGVVVRPAKRWLTRAQMAHAALCAAHAAWGALGGSGSHLAVAAIQGAHSVAGLGMLAAFYRAAYLRPRRPLKKVR